MRLLIFFNIFILFGIISFGQSDSLNAPRDSSINLKKGFYKKYSEFLNNSPSFTPDFTVKYFYKSETDSSIISAYFDSVYPKTDLGRFWGFCDGKNVFIRMFNSFHSQYFRLEYIGKISYFTYRFKEIAMAGPLLPAVIIAGVSASEPPQDELRLINKDGAAISVSDRYLRKVFKNNPDLLNWYSAEENLTEERMKEYIMLYNTMK